ncbi:hypothetical protein GEMRC1_011437 [Eukaryota sp. GEM-RC1]
MLLRFHYLSLLPFVVLVCIYSYTPLSSHVKSFPRNSYSPQHDPVTLLHVTDVHISTHTNRPTSHLHRLVTTIIPFYHPNVTLFTGDLINANTSSTPASRAAEWLQLNQTLALLPPDHSLLFSQGNHCMRKVDSSSSLFSNSTSSNPHSLSSPTSSSQLLLLILFSFPGLTNGLDFFAFMPMEFFNYLQTRRKTHVPSFVFTHYPSSMIFDPPFVLFPFWEFDYVVSGHVHKSSRVLIHDTWHLSTADLYKNNKGRLIVIDNSVVHSVLLNFKKPELTRVIVLNLPIIGQVFTRMEVLQRGHLRVLVYHPPVNFKLIAIIDDDIIVLDWLQSKSMTNLFTAPVSLETIKDLEKESIISQSKS